MNTTILLKKPILNWILQFILYVIGPVLKKAFISYFFILGLFFASIIVEAAKGNELISFSELANLEYTLLSVLPYVSLMIGLVIRFVFDVSYPLSIAYRLINKN